jgi:hypothetical protein
MPNKSSYNALLFAIAFKSTGGSHMATTIIRQITLRLPEPLYEQVRQLAKKRHVSINQLAQESLKALTQKAIAREMRAAYDALGTDLEETDVEVFLSAQSEVVRSEPA